MTATAPITTHTNLTADQRTALQELLNRECSKALDLLGDSIWGACSEFAERLNSAGDAYTEDLIREELIEMVEWNGLLKSTD